MSVTYNPKVLEKNSKQMYWSADVATVLLPVVGVAVGGMLGYALLKSVGALAGGALGGYLGLQYSDVKATALRSQAQTALCLAEIEKNTRHTS